MKVLLQTRDRATTIMTERLVVMRRVREPFAVEDLGMHTGDRRLLIVGSTGVAYPPALSQIACDSPEKIMLQFGGAGVFEAEYRAAGG